MLTQVNFKSKTIFSFCSQHSILGLFCCLTCVREMYTPISNRLIRCWLWSWDWFSWCWFFLNWSCAELDLNKILFLSADCGIKILNQSKSADLLFCLVLGFLSIFSFYLNWSCADLLLNADSALKYLPQSKCADLFFRLLISRGPSMKELWSVLLPFISDRTPYVVVCNWLTDLRRPPYSFTLVYSYETFYLREGLFSRRDLIGLLCREKDLLHRESVFLSSSSHLGFACFKGQKYQRGENGEF